MYNHKKKPYVSIITPNYNGGKYIEKTIKQGRNVVIWPSYIKQKDINDMVLAGHTKEELQQIIKDNTFSFAQAQLKLSEWRKIND